MKWYRCVSVVAAMAMAVTAGAARADVFNMGSGLTSLEFVTVGNPGNAADTRYRETGFGAVDYVYAIGKYEVTAGQYTAFLNAVAATDTYGLYNTNMWSSASGCKIQRSGTSGDYTYSVAADRANRPVNRVSWGDAARFMNWLHNGQPTGAQGLNTTEDGAYYLNGAMNSAQLMAVTRKDGAKYWIPTENEWYKAAYYDPNKPGGPGYWDYPTSSDSVPGRDLTHVSGNNANYYGDPLPIDSPYYTTVVGAFENSASPYGTFDQGGNVWEWNEIAVDSKYRGRRGGSWNDDSVYLLASEQHHTSIPVYELNSTIGFRVATVPEPGSITLMLCGALAGLFCWRRKRRSILN